MHCCVQAPLTLALVFAVAAAVAACEGPPRIGPADTGGAADASSPDPDPDAMALPDAAPENLFGASFVFDDVHIADFSEENNAFALLGMGINPGLQQSIQDGTFLLGMSFIDLDDPTGQSDETLSVGTFGLVDSDSDPTDNFDHASPEQFTIAEGGVLGDLPLLHFSEATIEDGRLFASRVSIVVLLEFLFPIEDAEFEGTLVPSEDGTYIAEIIDGRIRGAISGGPLALIPNPTAETCGGATMLDILATGCGFFPLQPDRDIDGDGIERYRDTDGDGSIDLCIDGDGTEIVGTDCATNPAMADGYSFAWVVHGVRANVGAPVPTEPTEPTEPK